MQKEVYEYISRQTNDPIIEWRVCRVSGEEFAIFQSDIDFLQKMSPYIRGRKYMLPSPTLSPEERARRRMSRKNDHHYFRRACDFSGESMTSIYHPSVPGPVYKVKYRRGDEWSGLDYGKEIDWGRSLFAQRKELHDVVPKIAMVNDDGIGSENCEFCQNVAYSKDCYLTTVSWKLRDCYYSSNMATGELLIDSFFTMDSRVCYECIESYGLYECFYLWSCSDCTKCFFGYELHGCSDCAFCVGLQNKQYCLFNEQLSAEEYRERVGDIRRSFLQTPSVWHEKRNIFFEKFPRKSANLVHTEETVGNNLVNAYQCRCCYNLKNAKQCKYRMFGDTGVAGVDLTVGGELELCYEGIVPDHSHQAGFTIFCWKCDDVWYSEMCHACQHCFACVGLKNKEYCILNKQYSKEVYEELVPQLIKRMQQDNERGEFFAMALSPFAYNHTIAQDYFPLYASSVEPYGSTRVEEKKEFNVPDSMHIINAKELPYDPHIISDDLLGKAIRCELSDRPFRIMPKELDFYTSYNIPLPHIHPLERYRARLAKMPEKTLYIRTCHKTGEEILSVYPPDAPFKVYSEEAYIQEVYG